MISSRAGLAIRARVPPVATAYQLDRRKLRMLPQDGEVIVQDKNGVPDFGALRAAITTAPHRLQFFAFDLLHLDGLDLRGAVLSDRRRILAELLAASRQARIVLSETIEGAAPVLLQPACELGLEGIVAKRAPMRRAAPAGRKAGSR